MKLHAFHRSTLSKRFNCQTKHCVLPQRLETIASALQSSQQNAALLFTGVSLSLLIASPALANEKVAEFKSSGFLFKDSIQVTSLHDADVEGVTIYFTDYNRSIAEKMTSKEDMLFADPSQSSLACVKTQKILGVPDKNKIAGPEGKEIFSELKTLNVFQNKKTRIRRIYDENDDTIIYIAYSTRNTTSSDEGGVSSSRFRTSMCAVPIGNDE